MRKRAAGSKAMIVIDFETTGLIKPGAPSEEQPGITEIAAALLDPEWNVKETWVRRVNPGKPIEFGASKATGITDEMVAGEPELTAFLMEFAKLTKRADTWVGYNAPFDRAVLYHQIQRYGWEMRFPWPYKMLDVMQAGSQVCNMQGKQGVKTPKLIEMHEILLGHKFEGAHAALNDVLATVACGRKLHELRVI